MNASVAFTDTPITTIQTILITITTTTTTTMCTIMDVVAIGYPLFSVPFHHLNCPRILDKSSLHLSSPPLPIPATITHTLEQPYTIMILQPLLLDSLPTTITITTITTEPLFQYIEMKATKLCKFKEYRILELSNTIIIIIIIIIIINE